MYSYAALRGQISRDVLSSFTYAASGKCDGKRCSIRLRPSHNKIDKIVRTHWLMLPGNSSSADHNLQLHVYRSHTRIFAAFRVASECSKCECCSFTVVGPILLYRRVHVHETVLQNVLGSTALSPDDCATQARILHVYERKIEKTKLCDARTKLRQCWEESQFCAPRFEMRISEAARKQ